MRRITVIVGIIICAGLFLLVAVKAQGWFASSLKTNSGLTPTVDPAIAPVIGAQNNRKLPPRIDGEEITLRPTGFFPKEIKRKKDPFILAINNLTGLGELSFQLARDKGEKISDKKLQKDQITSRQLLDLNPGRYILKVEAHPEWVCYLTITAK